MKTTFGETIKRVVSGRTTTYREYLQGVIFINEDFEGIGTIGMLNCEVWRTISDTDNITHAVRLQVPTCIKGLEKHLNNLNAFITLGTDNYRVETLSNILFNNAPLKTECLHIETKVVTPCDYAFKLLTDAQDEPKDDGYYTVILFGEVTLVTVQNKDGSFLAVPKGVTEAITKTNVVDVTSAFIEGNIDALATTLEQELELADCRRIIAEGSDSAYARCVELGCKTPLEYEHEMAFTQDDLGDDEEAPF